MTSRMWMVARALLALTAGTAVAPAAQAAQSKSVVELFTSQGCSSCPPADLVLAELAAGSKVIALSLPVDYWDYLGWKDTFAKPAFTARQRAYSLGRGDRQVYTPQAVVNGLAHANGASRGDISQAVRQTGSSVSVPVDLAREADQVTVSVAASGGAKGAMVIAMPVIGQREVAIGRGENARRKVIYTNIVREMVPLGTSTGEAALFKLAASTVADADSVVVILQAGTPANPGAILGAAQLALR